MFIYLELLDICDGTVRLASRTAGLVLFKHTIRLHKRFGTDTSFQAGNIKDAVERGRLSFGKGTSAYDDKALP